MSVILTNGVYENSNEALNYIGTWGNFIKNSVTMVYSESKGDYLEFSFYGAGFKWYTHTNAWRGMAKVYVDDIEKATIDTYSINETMDVVAYNIENLSLGDHKVKIEVLAQGNSKTFAYKIVIEKIEILLSNKVLEYQKQLEEKKILLQENLESQQELNNNIAIMEEQINYLKNPNGTTLIKGSYNNDNSNLKYIGTWGNFIKNGFTMIYSETKGNYMEFSFLGTGFKWYTHTNEWRGFAKVYIDSIEKEVIDCYSESEIMDVIVYSTDNLDLQTHIVKIEVLEEGNSKTYANKIVIEKIEVLQNITTEEYKTKLNDKKLKLEELVENQTQLEEEILKLENLISEEGSSTVVEVSNLNLSVEELILNKGNTYQLTWSIEPENATDKSIKFESGNTGFVTVNDTGLLTYVNEGETNISLTTSNNIIKYVKVICKSAEVVNPSQTESDEIEIIDDDAEIDISKAIESKKLINEGISIANESETLEIGDKIKIIAHILPYNVLGGNPYILKTSNEDIIKINKGKVIEAVGIGNAIITAYSLDGKYKDEVKFTVKSKEEYSILESEIYDLEIDRFNIAINDNSEAVAIKNSLGINAALKYCSRYGYKQIKFPENVLIYVEPKITIYMVSNVWVDLNGSKLKLRANDYERYSAINFSEGNINLLNEFDISEKVKGTFIGTKNVIKTTIKSSSNFSSNLIIVRTEKIQSEYNQNLSYLVYGDKADLSLQIARNTIVIDSSKNYSATGIIYVDYFNESTLIASQKLRDIWVGSSTAQYFSINQTAFKLRDTTDYNGLKIRIQWNLSNATADVYMGEISLIKKVTSVLTNVKLFNGTIIGERDEKATVYSNWASISSTEGGVSILFSEGYNNGIENLNVKKSIGFNISSGVGANSYGVVSYSLYPISYKMMELGTLDENGQTIEYDKLIRTNEFIDISKITTPYYEIGYHLGYHGYPYVTCRIYDVCFYDINKKFIRKDRGRLRFRRYSKPENAYYAKFIFYSNVVPTSGNSDFNGAFAFVENFEYPIKNFIKNCIIEDNYSCGFAACGGQKWIIKNNIWRKNSGRMPGCDIDWEDGWEYMQDDLVEGNSFESYNNVILCAGAGQVYSNNKFNGITTVYGRSQYWSFIDNIVQDTTGITNGNGAKLSLGSSTDVYLERNKYIKSSMVWSANHGSSAEYDIYIKNEDFNNSNILNGGVKNVKYSTFTGSNFSLYSTNVFKCELNTGLITTNSKFSYSNIKSIAMRPTKNSNVIIDNSYLYNFRIDPSVQFNDVIISNCKIIKDIIGEFMTASSNSTGGVIVNNCTFKFNSLSDYHYLIGGWNASGCTANYTFNNCFIEIESEFKGYLVACTWYPVSTDTNHITLNFNNTDVSMFEKINIRGLNSNVVININ